MSQLYCANAFFAVRASTQTPVTTLHFFAFAQQKKIAVAPRWIHRRTEFVLAALSSAREAESECLQMLQTYHGHPVLNDAQAAHSTRIVLAMREQRYRFCHAVASEAVGICL
jgi:hypothetical protein